MKKGKKLLFCSLLILTASVIFIACGGGGGDGNTDSNKLYLKTIDLSPLVASGGK